MKARLLAALSCVFACASSNEPRERPAAETPTVDVDADPAPIASAAPPAPKPWPADRAEADRGGDHLYSKVRFLWIYPEPRASEGWIGYLSLGDAVRVAGGVAASATVRGSGKCTTWYRIEPSGFVCGDDASTDANHPDIAELRKHVAKHEPLPYRYAESHGTAVYLDIPPRRRQFFRETAFDAHMANIQAARQAKSEEEIAKIDPNLVGVDLRPTGNARAPSLLHLGPRSRPLAAAGKYGFPEVFPGSTVAYTHTFDADERSWLLTWDRGIVPLDRVRPYRASEFQGVALGDIALPIAFVRRAQPKWHRNGDALLQSKESWPKYAAVPLSGEAHSHEGERYLVARDGSLLQDRDVSVATQRDDVPKVVAERGARTWIDISITGGWLVAYEGTRPVYATMVSPGRGGMPVEGKPLLDTASTPVGDFTISGKFHTATMTSNFSDKIVHAEVPYTQNFNGPYALHVAYWHDDWGIGKSGGCVNIAPIDGMRLFAWTEPRLPPGWHGMRAQEMDAKRWAPATIVSVHR